MLLIKSVSSVVSLETFISHKLIRKKKIQPKTWLWKRVIRKRNIWVLISHSVQAQSASPMRLMVSSVAPPHPQPSSSSAEVMWWEALPSSTEANFSFLSISQKIFYPFHACPQISLTIHILDRKHMLTVSKIDHCGINYRNVETSM